MGHCVSVVEFQNYDEINRNTSFALFIKPMMNIDYYTKDNDTIDHNISKHYELFVDYIKTGVWLEKLVNFDIFEEKENITIIEIMDDLNINESKSVNNQNNPLLSYIIPEKYSISIRECCNSSISNNFQVENNNEYRIRKHPNNILKSYPDFNVKYFTLDELLLLLFCIIYPIYLETSLSNEKDKLGSSSDLGSPNSCCYYGTPSPYRNNNNSNNSSSNCFLSSPFSETTNHKQQLRNNHKLIKRTVSMTKDTSLTQEILYTTAAFFDGWFMLQVLNQNQWIDKVIQLIDNCEFGITIIDVRNEFKNYPIIYLNNAIYNIYGLHQKYYGKSFFSLVNPLKEYIDVIKTKFIDALNHSKPLKIAFRNQNSHTNNIFTNFIKIKPIFNSQGDYICAMCIHYDLEGGKSTMDDLHKIDDIMALIPRLIHTKTNNRENFIRKISSLSI